MTATANFGSAIFTLCAQSQSLNLVEFPEVPASGLGIF
jgi:hypothetical protein